MTVEPDSTDLASLCSLADSRRDAGDLEGALTLSQRAIESFPDRPGGYVRAAQALFESKRFDEAQRVVEQGLALFPSHPQLLLLAMGLSRKQGDLEGTLGYANTLMQARPDRREAYARATQALIALRRVDEADSLIREALAKFPNWVRLLSLASDTERLKGSRDASLRIALKMTELQGDRPEGYCRAIQDLLALGDISESQRIVSMAQARLPGDPRVMHAALDVARSAGDVPTAMELLASASTAGDSDWTLMRAAQQVVAMLSDTDAQELTSQAYARLLHRIAVPGVQTGPDAVAGSPGDQRRFERGIHILTRFSIFDPAFGGFQALRKADSSEAYADSLFAKDRMSFKFDVFENVTLPSLLKQQDRDFTWHILASDRLHVADRERLVSLAEEFHWIDVRFVSSMAPLFHMEFGNDAISVRLDDDDYLEEGFISRLRAARQRPGTLLSFPWGRKYEWVDQSMRTADHGFYVPNNAQGLTAFGMNVFGCGRHTTVDDAFEVVYDYSPDMFYVCCSEFCDTNRWFSQEAESTE